MKKKFIGIIIVFGIIFFIGYKQLIILPKECVEQVELKEGEFRYNEDGTTSIGYNMASLGFYNIESGKRIKTGSVIRPIDGKIKGRINYQQNFPEGCNYILIAMIDYKKHDIVVDGVTYKEYSFSLEKKDEINIDILLEGLNNDEKDFTFFVVNDINVHELYEKEKENITMWMLRETKRSFAQRYLLSEIVNNIEIKKDYKEFNTNDVFIIDLVKTHKTFEPMPIYNSDEELEVIIKNIYDEDMTYAVFAFLDWEQIPLNANDSIKYIKIPAKASIYFKVKVPQISERKYFQIYYIPQVNSNDVNRYSPESSFKTLIIP